jgi:hypothetical protein
VPSKSASSKRITGPRAKNALTFDQGGAQNRAGRCARNACHQVKLPMQRFRVVIEEALKVGDHFLGAFG